MTHYALLLFRFIKLQCFSESLRLLCLILINVVPFQRRNCYKVEAETSQHTCLLVQYLTLLILNCRATVIRFLGLFLVFSFNPFSVSKSAVILLCVILLPLPLTLLFLSLVL